MCVNVYVSVSLCKNVHVCENMWIFVIVHVKCVYVRQKMWIFVIVKRSCMCVCVEICLLLSTCGVCCVKYLYLYI